MLRLPHNITLDIVSDQIAKLDHPDFDTIQVPAKIPPDVGFGVTALIIQLLALWSRRHTERILNVAGQPLEEMLNNLAKEPHGSAAIYFSNVVKGPKDFSKKANEARRHLIPIIQAMQQHRYRETSGIRGVHLCCFSGSVNEYVSPLYSRGDENSLRNAHDFFELIHNVIGAFEPTALRKLSPESLKFIASIVYELFSNTHEHARHDEHGNIYLNGNIRGIAARTVEYREGKDTYISTHLSQYMALAAAKQRKLQVDPEINKNRAARVLAGFTETDSIRAKSRGSTRFLEFTIYDTGPGLARRWAANNKGISGESLSFNEELKLVKECFVIGNTTKKINGVGQGLSYSISSLKKLGAFMALRTGRTFLYQNFLSIQSEGFLPQHWYSENPEQGHLPGTTFTIVIPLNGDAA